MADETLIQIRVAGAGIIPGTMRSKEIAEIISAVEDMIASLVIRENRDLQKDEIVVGLVNVEKGSLVLDFVPALPRYTLPAFELTADAVTTNTYQHLPASTLTSLNALASVSRRHQCDIEMRTVDEEVKTLAVITPSTIIERIPLIPGWTTIYGRVLRVGGKEPKVMLELPSGNTLSCDVNESLARRLGKRLYAWVGLQGYAKWDSEKFYLQEFKVEEITEYEEGSITEAFKELSGLIGEYFDDIPDVDAYVSRIRGGQETDL